VLNPINKPKVLGKLTMLLKKQNILLHSMLMTVFPYLSLKLYILRICPKSDFLAGQTLKMRQNPHLADKFRLRKLVALG
jgi:hypothetical protein